MTEQFDYWLFLAGIGVFLFGMHYMEVALKKLAGRSFKKFLRKHTTNPIKGVLGGAGITAILQSSSVVSLMTMAFVGARIITMRNALGVIFGCNLGTTVTGWIVALIGFKLNLEGISLPLVATGALLSILFSKTEALYTTGRFLFGFGLLFLGLVWMKSSIEYLSSNFDFSQFADIPIILFFFVGLIMTAIIQSSSAMMVIILSTLSVGAISLEAAAITIIGANVGTTITIVLGALKGTEATKQLALGQVLFNLITGVITLFLLLPLLWVIREVFLITDSLVALVTFHSIFNLVGIIAFLPFTGRFAHFLEKRFVVQNTLSNFISKVQFEEPSAATEAMKNECKRFIGMVLSFNKSILTSKNFELSVSGVINFFQADKSDESYKDLKKLEGEIVAYSLQVQNEEMTSEESNLIQIIQHGLSKAMQSAKNVKDIHHNMHEYESSGNDAKLRLFLNLKKDRNRLYEKLTQFTENEDEENPFGALVELNHINHSIHQHTITKTYQEVQKRTLNEHEIATFLNVNREFYISTKSIIHAMSDFWLTAKESEDFNKMPEIHN